MASYLYTEINTTVKSKGSVINGCYEYSAYGLTEVFHSHSGSTFNYFFVWYGFLSVKLCTLASDYLLFSACIFKNLYKSCAAHNVDNYNIISLWGKTI